MHHLSPRAIWLFAVKNFFYYILPGFFIYAISSIIWMALMDLFFDAPEALAIFLGAFTYLAFCYLMARWYYHHFTYHLEQHLIKIEKGIFRKKSTAIPFARVQNVNIRRGPLARLFGLSLIEIETAGGVFEGVPEGSIPGLDQHVAAQLRTQLMSGGKYQL